MRYVLKQDSAWLGKQPAASGNERRLFCICGEVSLFDPTKLRRFMVSTEIYRRGYASVEEIPLFER